MKIHSILCSLAILAGSQLGNSNLHAQMIYTQSFATPDGELPADWQVAGYFNPAYGTAQITNDPLAALYQIRESTDQPSGNSFVFYSGSFGDVQNGIFSDFSASAIFQLGAAGSNDGFRGVMLRATVSGTSPAVNGYYIGFNEAGTLGIYLNPNAASSTGTMLISENIGALEKSISYMLSVSAVGKTISAEIYAWNSEAQSYSDRVGGVSVEDETYSSGIFGFRTAFGGRNRWVYWSDLELTVIPEPSSAALMISTGLLSLALLKGNRKQPPLD